MELPSTETSSLATTPHVLNSTPSPSNIDSNAIPKVAKVAVEYIKPNRESTTPPAVIAPLDSKYSKNLICSTQYN